MTGTERQFNGDLHAYWDQIGIPPGQFAERMVAWKALPQNAAWIDATEDADAPEVVAGLWKNGEQGVWYDPSDLSTMYQDAAGTTPCYQPGQGQVDPPVGKILDKSGRGNHATQPTTTCRPTLSARYNLLTATQEFGATAWVKVDATVGISENVAEAPNGTLTADQITLGVGMRGIRQDAAFSGSGVQSIWVKVAPSGSATHIRVSTNNASAWNTGLSKKVALTAEWQRLELAGGLNSGGVAIRVSIGTVDATGAVDTDCYGNVLIWGADLRPANDGVGLPPYQRVVDANTYDTVGFPLYLKFDGVDDWLQTVSIDFTTTDKVIAATALRKLSDAAVGVAFELSATAAGNNGAFLTAAPITASVANLYWQSNGTAASAATSPSAYPAPVSSILTGLGDISGDKAILRVNGSQVAQSGSDQGAGAYGNYPLYIGRRGGTSLSFNGRLYGLLIRGAATPDATITKVERYLNQKARIY